jgi:iron complex transport system ATP-binding protein
MNGPLIDIRNVSVEIGGRKLVSDINLTLHQGEVLALLGPNGAGKSTLLRAASGDISPTSGEIRIDNRPIASFKPKELALRRAVLPQQTVLQFAFTAREVVEMGLGERSRRHVREADDQIVDRSMERTDVDHLQDRTYPTLSGGEQARVALARVLSQQAPIILLDEPTASLDLSHQQMVMEIAREIAANGGAVMTILHDINLAAAYADRLALLDGGKLVSLGEPWTALDPELLTKVFECPIAVAHHPMRNCPLVLPLPRIDAHMHLAGRELTISDSITTHS